MLKTRTWILLFAGLAALSLLALGLLRLFRTPGTEAKIYQDGVCVETIDLSRVTSGYSFVLEDGDGGSNTILVEPGRICVSEADCPDQICVRQGWLSDSAGNIVCLPYGLVIRIDGESELDAVAQ